MEKENQPISRGPNDRRNGLRRANRIVEPKLQPEETTDKIGNVGRVVKLQSNFTKFSVLKTDKYMMYDTVFSVAGLSPKAKLQFLVRVCQENKLTGAFCFDGRRLFTSEKWHGENEITEFGSSEKTVTIRLVSTILPDTEEFYQMVNVLLNNLQVMLGQERIGKGYFLSPNTARGDIPQNSGPTYFETNNFKVLGGFGTTLQRGTKPSGELTTLLYIERINRVLNDNSVCKSYNRRNIDQLIGRDVITKYNNKTYRISDVKEMNINETFEMSGRTLSYLQYFKERYNIVLQQPDQPFVLTRVKRQMRRDAKRDPNQELETPEDKDLTLNIPGELCYLCGFSDQEKSNIDLQKNLGGVLKRGPRERLEDIPSFCDWIRQSKVAQAMNDKWQLKIDNSPLEIEGRELPGFDVISGGKKINDKAKDDWKFGRVQFSTGGAKHVVDVVIVDRNDSQYGNFLNDVENEFRNLRIDARLGKVATCGPNDVENTLNDVARSGSNCSKIALVFVPDDRVYAKVKSFTMSTGLLTQCVTTRNGVNRNDKRRQVVSNKTVMQIFCKFGYDPWTVEIKMKPTMIIGMDTYHNKSSKKSIHASVFSTNSNFTQYMSFINSPKGKQEFHETLGKNFHTALLDFKKRFNILPLRLIVFRDGVGDGQLQFTKQFEVDAMKPMIEAIYKEFGLAVPQIIYVIVKKRISTKLFNRGDNPNPGTVVDKEIVKPNFYEYFVVSQRVTKGTATPTNYNVLEDTRLLTKSGSLDPIAPNELQSITYALTHLYFNWMGTIRVPVPVHYAHRLAELVGKVHKGSSPATINERIRNRLFYL